MIFGNDNLEINLQSSIQISCKQIRVRKLNDYQIIPSEVYTKLFEDLQSNKLIPKNPRILVQTHGLTCIVGNLPPASGSLCIMIDPKISVDIVAKFLTESVSSNAYLSWKAFTA